MAHPGNNYRKPNRSAVKQQRDLVGTFDCIGSGDNLPQAVIQGYDGYTGNDQLYVRRYEVSLKFTSEEKVLAFLKQAGGHRNFQHPDGVIELNLKITGDEKYLVRDLEQLDQSLQQQGQLSLPIDNMKAAVLADIAQHQDKYGKPATNVPKHLKR